MEYRVIKAAEGMATSSGHPWIKREIRSPREIPTVSDDFTVDLSIFALPLKDPQFTSIDALGVS
jgi:hypothetical protein